MKRKIHSRTFSLYLVLLIQLVINSSMIWLLKDKQVLLACHSLFSLITLVSIFLIERKSLLLMPLNWILLLGSYFYLNKPTIMTSVVLATSCFVFILIWIFWRKYLKRVYYFHCDFINNIVKSDIVSIKNDKYSIVFTSEIGLVLQGQKPNDSKTQLISFEMGGEQLEVEGKLMLSIDNYFGFRLNGSNWSQINDQLSRLGYGFLKE